MKFWIFPLILLSLISCGGGTTFQTGSLPTQTYNNEAEIRIPVIFHVVHDHQDEISSDKIKAELNNLHDDFLMSNTDIIMTDTIYRSICGNANIKFYLADTILSEKGIIRLPKTKSGKLCKTSPVINPKKYLNVYIGDIYNIFSKTVGVVYYPEIWRRPELDAVFLQYDRIGNNERILTHEVGHWLGLYHTFQGRKNCRPEFDDGINDTPFQNVQSGNSDDPNKYFITDPKTNNCGGNLPAMYNNFMDYSNCRVMFTLEQCSRMRRNLLLYRNDMYVNGIVL